MTERQPQNITASIRARLLNLSRQSGEDFQFLLQRYAAERFLYRLGRSTHRDRFVLKGAMLFALWGGSLYRATRDLDFTAYGSSEAASVRAAIQEICGLAVENDGLLFDAAALTIEPIRDDAEYGGLRINFLALLGNARIPMQIDIGFGNAVEPPAQDADYPTLLPGPAPRIRAYPHEAVVAEKFHALVVLGDRNSRLKDFYDLYVLARRFAFEGRDLARAMGATFERRRTPIEGALPSALTPRFFTDAARAEQWRAYLTRNGLPGASADFGAVGEMIQSFLRPVWDALSRQEAFMLHWPQSGPWKEMQ